MPESLATLFGRAVRRRREAAGLSQEVLAEAVAPRLTRNYVGMVERGETNPTLAVMQGLAAALGATVTELVGEAEAGFKGTHTGSPPGAGSVGHPAGVQQEPVGNRPGHRKPGTKK